MHLLRSSLIPCLCLAAIIAATPGLFAQQSQAESIYIAGSKVITIRDKGDAPTVRDRAVAIDKAITQIISTQDTQKLDITMREVNGLWTIFSGPVKIASVYEAEAKTNGLPAKSLAAVWVKNLRTQFPKATPCSKLPASAFQPAATAPGTGSAPAPAPKPAPKPDEVAVPPGTAPAPMPTRAPAATGPTVTGAPELLVRDAFNTVRALAEEEFVAKRDELVAHLIEDLTPFITGKVASALRPGGSAQALLDAPIARIYPVSPLEDATASAVTPPPTPVETPVATPPAPAEVPSETAPPPAASTPPTPPTAPTAALPAAAGLPEAVAGDASYAKVPQKNRIRQKLEASREPYLKLRQEAPDVAKPIADLQANCRSAFAQGNFDESERYIDAALQLLGVTWKPE